MFRLKTESWIAWLTACRTPRPTSVATRPRTSGSNAATTVPKTSRSRISAAAMPYSSAVRRSAAAAVSKSRSKKCGPKTPAWKPCLPFSSPIAWTTAPGDALPTSKRTSAALTPPGGGAPGTTVAPSLCKRSWTAFSSAWNWAEWRLNCFERTTTPSCVSPFGSRFASCSAREDSLPEAPTLVTMLEPTSRRAATEAVTTASQRTRTSHGWRAEARASLAVISIPHVYPTGCAACALPRRSARGVHSRRDREHAAPTATALRAGERRRALAEAREPQPDRLRQGPDGALDDRRRRARRADLVGRHRRRIHRRLDRPGPRARLPGEGLPRAERH